MTKLIRHLFFFVLILKSYQVFSDSLSCKPGYIHIKKKSGASFDITQVWLYHNGDDMAYAKSDYNDQNWDTLHSYLYQESMTRSGFKGKAWFRIHVSFDSADALKPYVFSIDQKGASEIYFNGILVKTIGTYGSKAGMNNGDNNPLYFVPLYGVQNVIAIRYENIKYEHSYNSLGILTGGFYSSIEEPESYFRNALMQFTRSSLYGMGLFSFFFSIGLIHFLLYVFYKSRKSNLLFSLFCFLFSYYFLHYFLTTMVLTQPLTKSLFVAFFVITVPFFFLSLLSVIYSLFYDKNPKLIRYLFVASVLCSILLMTFQILGYLVGILLVLIIVIEVMRVIIVANRKRKKGAGIISIGFGAFVLFLSYIFLTMLFNKGSFILVAGSITEKLFFVSFILTIVSIPISMSTFLAWDFAQTNKTLSKKLIEVEDLSAKTIEQEKDRQKILSEQNEKLEAQVHERTKEIHEQKKLIEEKNKDITDSINYAQRIQNSILPTAIEISDIFDNFFVLFKPRDIVSGDFYQFKKVGDYKFCILADCTGHGVPGALMSMIGSNLLNQIIVERKVLAPHLILSELHKEVKSTLRQTSGMQSHDGMDASVVLLKGEKLFISSANRPVYIVQNGEISEIKPDKRSIGGSQSSDDAVFIENEITVQSGMMVYLFSDGYADQFGGETGKKFKVKNLSGLLLSIHEKPLHLQHEILNSTFDAWKNQLEQVDDVSLIGIRL